MRRSNAVVSDDEVEDGTADVLPYSSPPISSTNARMRRLRVVLSDDEVADIPAAVQESSPDSFTSASPPIPPTNANPSPTTLHNISDDDQDDFVTADDYSTPSPPVLSNPSPPAISTHNTQNLNSNPRIMPIDSFLRRLGLCIRREWLEACWDRIAGTMHGYDGLDDGTKAKKVFEQFLVADLNEFGAGVLPENVGMMHKAELDGPFVLQVDEIVNISAPIKERYQNALAGPKRCLKLSMTDGVQRIFGIEYRSIKELEVLAPSGFKVVVRNVQVRRGLLMLVPEIMSFLGGMVDDLDQARQRLVSEVNKPPRGKRKQGGIPLSRRASLAAWSSSIGAGMADGVTENITSSPAPQRANQDQQARPTHSPATASGVTIDARNTNPTMRPNQPQEITMAEVDNSHAETPSFNQSRDSPQVRTWGSHISHGRSIDCPQQPSSINEENPMNQRRDAERLQGGGTSYVIDESMTSTNEEPSTSHGRNPAPLPGISGRSNAIEENDMVIDGKTSPLNNRRDSENMKYCDTLVIDRSMATQNNMFVDDEADDIIMDSISDDGRNDKLEIKDYPFTYMSSLLSQWAEEDRTQPFIRGRIKCFLTGVNSKFGFQGKFELKAYIDDGSLISLVKIDHNVIQKWVGYTPEEVVAGLKLSGTKTEADIRQTMRSYQVFLSQFEGTVVIEFNENSDLPIAIEMNQGCSSDAANLLLRRLLAMEQ